MSKIKECMSYASQHGALPHWWISLQVGRWRFSDLSYFKEI